MGLFDWLRRPPPAAQPEAQWLVTLSENRIEVRDPEGAVHGLEWTGLGSVKIETNDSGPWGADFWWLLFDRDGRLACAFPQGATGEDEAMQSLTALPGFDHEEMLRATTSVDNAIFNVWRGT